jgi:hypothetical protein
MHSARAACKHNQADVQGNRIEAARWVEHHHFVLHHIPDDIHLTNRHNKGRPDMTQHQHSTDNKARKRRVSTSEAREHHAR